jgi:hypothetical protein
MTDREFRHVQGELDEVMVKLKAALDPLAARGARIEFRKRERRRLIEWFRSKDIEKIEDNFAKTARRQDRRQDECNKICQLASTKVLQ